MTPRINFKLQDKVKKYLESNSPQKFPASDIAAWILSKYPSECQKKKNASTVIRNDDDLVKALTAEIAAYRPRLQKKYWQIKSTEDRPRLYSWETKTDTDDTETSKEPPVQESKLYPVLCKYLGAREPKIYPLRIDEKVSSNTKGSQGNKWLYPDVVGMENLQHDWNLEIQEAAEKHPGKRTRLWSFEVKRKLTRGNVREAFFQAVSNSSWANFSYLVTGEIVSDQSVSNDTLKELQMLASLHGTGLIALDCANPADSLILIPARERPDVDWTTCNRIAQQNKDFLEFITLIREFYLTRKLRSEAWDLPTENEDMQKGKTRQKARRSSKPPAS